MIYFFVIYISTVFKFPVGPSQHSPVVFLRDRIVPVELFSKLVADVSKVWRQKCRGKVKGIIFSATCLTPSFRSPEALISCWAPFDYSENYQQPLSIIQQCIICSYWTSSKLLLLISPCMWGWTKIFFYFFLPAFFPSPFLSFWSFHSWFSYSSVLDTNTFSIPFYELPQFSSVQEHLLNFRQICATQDRFLRLGQLCVCLCVCVCVRARFFFNLVAHAVCHDLFLCLPTMLRLEGSLTGIPSTYNFPRCDSGLKTDDMFGYSIVFVVKTHAGRHQSSKLVVSLRVRFSPWVQPVVQLVIFHGFRSYDARCTLNRYWSWFPIFNPRCIS